MTDKNQCNHEKLSINEDKTFCNKCGCLMYNNVKYKLKILDSRL